MWHRLKRPQTIVGIGGVIASASRFLAELFSGGFSMAWPLSVGQWAGIFGMFAGTGLIVWGLVQGEPDTERGNLLEDIEQDLVTMNTIERNTATKISSQIDLAPTIVLQIGKDYERLLNDFWGKLINIILNKDYGALVEYCDTVGQILDMHKVGLKSAVIDNEEYKAAKLDLEQKRLRLKPEKRYRFTQANIVSVERLSYGVNSHIILRGVLANPAGYVEVIPMEIRRELEEAENTSETILKIMLDDLEGDWTREKKK
jgi:hypothetical protein